MNQVVTTYTLDEFKAIQKKQQHPHLGLYQMDGTRVVAYNAAGAGKGIDEKLREIETTLQNPSLPDGVYIIKGKASLHPGGVSLDYPIIKGDPETVTAETLQEAGKSADDFKQYDPSVTSFSNVLELRVENERLKILVEALEAENAELIAELQEYEKEAEEAGLLNEQPEHWSSNLKEMGETLIAMMNPVIEKHYQLKERQLNLDEHRFKAQHVGAPQQSQPAQHIEDQNAVNYTNQKIVEFIGLHEGQPEVHESMAKNYNESESMDDFFRRFEHDQGQEKYVELQNYINGQS